MGHSRHMFWCRSDESSFSSRQDASAGSIPRRIPGDWDSEAVDGVLAACRNRAPASGEAGLAAVRAGALTAACAGLGRSRARDGVGIAETIDDLAALFAVLGWGEGGRAG